MLFTATIVAFHHLSVSILWIRAAAVAFAACVFSLSFAFTDEVRCGILLGEEGASTIAAA